MLAFALILLILCLLLLLFTYIGYEAGKAEPKECAKCNSRKPVKPKVEIPERYQRKH